jgi:hypothetical protein
MSPLRWLATIVAYPIGGLIAIQFVSVTWGPLAAAVAGLIAGSVLGVAQWLALRPRVSAIWVGVTAAAFAVGAALGSIVIGGSTAATALATFGAVAGTVVGLAQALALRVDLPRVLAWVGTVALTWSVAWIISSVVIVDENRGFITFGLSGAALVAIVGAAVLRGLLGARRPIAPTVDVVHA